MSADLDHIAVKVSDIESFSSALAGLGYTLESVKQHDEVGMKIAFMAPPSPSAAEKMELLEVTDPDSPISGDPEGLHHLAVSVPDIEESYRMMSEDPLYAVEGTIRQGAHTRIFFFRMTGQKEPLFECCEQKGRPSETRGENRQ
ncbi:MAG: VOC family protein [Spirochaetales bacterium]|nr:VOC family protein [Spirochaetales bacterium]